MGFPSFQIDFDSSSNSCHNCLGISFIVNVIKNTLEKNLGNRPSYHFYLDKFVSQVFTNTITWHKVSSTANTTTGMSSRAEYSQSSVVGWVWGICGQGQSVIQSTTGERDI